MFNKTYTTVCTPSLVQATCVRDLNGPGRPAHTHTENLQSRSMRMRSLLLLSLLLLAAVALPWARAQEAPPAGDAVIADQGVAETDEAAVAAESGDEAAAPNAEVVILTAANFEHLTQVSFSLSARHLCTATEGTRIQQDALRCVGQLGGNTLCTGAA
jgi:hypothetical protein